MFEIYNILKGYISHALSRLLKLTNKNGSNYCCHPMKKIKMKDKNNRFSWKFTIGSEATTVGVLLEKVLFKILQNSQENTCVRVSFY